jgi:hypothetical protein
LHRLCEWARNWTTCGASVPALHPWSVGVLLHPLQTTSPTPLPIPQLEREKQAYEEALRAGPKLAPGQAAQLNMRIRLVNGDEVIADTEEEGGSLPVVCAKFKAWLDNRVWP